MIVERLTGSEIKLSGHCFQRAGWEDLGAKKKQGKFQLLLLLKDQKHEPSILGAEPKT